MKKALPHRSMHKKNEFNEIVRIIRSIVDIKMIILFGSYARGDRVEDIYTDPEDHITYEYSSDIDILAVTETPGQASSIRIWDKADQLINKCDVITKEELEYLSLRVEKLMKITEEICKNKIEKTG